MLPVSNIFLGHILERISIIQFVNFVDSFVAGLAQESQIAQKFMPDSLVGFVMDVQSFLAPTRVTTPVTLPAHPESALHATPMLRFEILVVGYLFSVEI